MKTVAIDLASLKCFRFEVEGLGLVELTAQTHFTGRVLKNDSWESLEAEDVECLIYRTRENNQ
jgi:hypothetical protein